MCETSRLRQWATEYRDLIERRIGALDEHAVRLMNGLVEHLINSVALDELEALSGASRLAEAGRLNDGDVATVEHE